MYIGTYIGRYVLYLVRTRMCTRTRVYLYVQYVCIRAVTRPGGQGAGPLTKNVSVDFV